MILGHKIWGFWTSGSWSWTLTIFFYLICVWRFSFWWRNSLIIFWMDTNISSCSIVIVDHTMFFPLFPQTAPNIMPLIRRGNLCRMCVCARACVCCVCPNSVSFNGTYALVRITSKVAKCVTLVPWLLLPS